MGRCRAGLTTFAFVPKLFISASALHPCLLLKCLAFPGPPLRKAHPLGCSSSPLPLTPLPIIYKLPLFSPSNSSLDGAIRVPYCSPGALPAQTCALTSAHSPHSFDGQDPNRLPPELTCLRRPCLSPRTCSPT